MDTFEQGKYFFSKFGMDDLSFDVILGAYLSVSYER